MAIISSSVGVAAIPSILKYIILFLGIIVMGHCGMTGALDWHNMHIIIIVHNNFITGD